MQDPSKNSPTTAPKLLNQVRGKICLKHYSIRTEQAYTDWIRRFILYHGKKHPRDMGAAEVGQFRARSRERIMEPHATPLISFYFR